MELDSTEMIKRFVLAGLGIGFLAATHVPGRSGKGNAGRRFLLRRSRWFARLVSSIEKTKLCRKQLWGSSRWH